MNLFENLQIMKEASTFESEVDYSVLKQNDIDFFENGAGVYRVVTPDEDTLDIEIEAQNDNGITKYFVSLPSEDVRTVDSDLTAAILTVVDKLSGPPFHKENVEKLNESTNEDFVKQEREKYGITERSYGTNHAMLELEPTDEAATEFTNKIENDGYRLITTQKDGVKGDITENDVTLVYGKEVENNRCIISVSIHPSENSVIVSCGYDEADGAAEFFESKEPEEIIEWDADVFDDQYDDGEDKVESSILEDEKDMEQIVENEESLTEDVTSIESLQAKADKFGKMVDTLGTEMPTSEVNNLLKGLSTDLNMDVYDGDEPYPTDLEGYFGMPASELDLTREDDMELVTWIDDILTDCIKQMKQFIEERIKSLEVDCSSIENKIAAFKELLEDSANECLTQVKENNELITFNISFIKNNVPQANLIKAFSEDEAIEYFKNYKDGAEIVGIKVATNDDMKPGKPVIDTTK